jgi:Mg2+/Co2+ transporter CorB
LGGLVGHVVVVVVVVVYVYVCMHTPLLYTLRVKINNLAKRGQGGANTLFCVLYYGG